jgi:hypothetical protein
MHFMVPFIFAKQEEDLTCIDLQSAVEFMTCASLVLVNYYGYNTPYPCRLSGGQILEALHSDPASSLSVEQERTAKLLKPPPRFVMMIAML